MERTIKAVIDEVLSKIDEVCKCEKCKEYMLNQVVNHLCVKYSIPNKNLAYLRVQGVDNQLKIDATIKITEIVNKIKNTPLH